MSEELRWKVIKGLECCSGISSAYECPYQGSEGCDNCRGNIYLDALSLLKAQKPILLENQHKPYGHIINANSPWISRCPKCNKKIEGKQTKFCKYCGQVVKWE